MNEDYHRPTSINLALLHVLARHRVRLDDVRKRVGLEVPLAGLLLGVVLSSILLHALEVVVPASKLVLSLLKELASLLPHLHHPVRRVPHHLNDSGNLVILR